MDWKQQKGGVCETILAEYLMRNNFYVLRPYSAFGPVDIIAYNEQGRVYLLDAKADRFRTNPNRTNPTRINRPRSRLQKLLGVHLAYVNFDTREVHFTPKIEGL